MPSIRYINQTAPFWDFVASLENQGVRGESTDEETGEAGPWGPWGPWAGRRWHHAHPHRHGPHGPHGPQGPQGPNPPSGPGEGSPDTVMGDGNEKEQNKNADDAAEAGPSQPREDGPSCRNGGCHRGRGAFRGRRGPCGPGAWGRRGPFPHGGPFGPGAFGPWGDFLKEQVFGQGPEQKDGEQADFKPELDVFDTETSYVVHVSLPGAKKEDVGVNWDPEKSELSVAGVIYRPGDEDLIKTLALDGRRVGPFEAKVRLGSRANPAQVEADGITAKLEDGILVIDVPKLDKDYVEVKKVDIE